jgi:hypothetical protein
MPTARELLEQADALMRRNRGDTGIPVLTDSVPEAMPAVARSGLSTPDRTGTAARTQATETRAARDNGQREDPPRVADGERVSTAPPAPAPDPLATAEHRVHPAEPPLLTDVVEEVVNDILRASPLASAEGEPSLWLGPDTIDPSLHSITGPAPDTVAVVPAVTLRSPEPTPDSAKFEDDRDPTVTRTLRAAGSAPTPPPAGSTPPTPLEPPAAALQEPVAAPANDDERWLEPPAAALQEPVAAPANDDERWRALAEQISMQVLQRLDLFVDTGLKAQLAGHLQPIVARASAELVEAINDHVGQLVRTYVAEAIEREIAQWRQQNK